MRTAVLSMTAILIVLAAPVPADPSVSEGPPKPGWEYTPQDFGIGRRHTPNNWCNRQIDKLLEETRQCFNTRPAAACETLRKKNSKKIGGYIKSTRCLKQPAR